MFVPINHGHKDSTVCTKSSVHIPVVHPPASSQQCCCCLCMTLTCVFILSHNFLFLHNAVFSYTKNCARRLTAPISGMLRCRTVDMMEALPHARWDARCSRMGKVKM